MTPHDLVGVTVTNAGGRVSVCSCSWASEVVYRTRELRQANGERKTRPDPEQAERDAVKFHQAHAAAERRKVDA